ncbi:MAG: hypothetical protein Q7U91_14950 [Sideroxyarcus sp.]|nr:hypothetical protein [Sideroxyarcus sp.]
MQPAIFEEREIRRVYDEGAEIWSLTVVDIVQVLMRSMENQHLTQLRDWHQPLQMNRQVTMA